EARVAPARRSLTHARQSKTIRSRWRRKGAQTKNLDQGRGGDMKFTKRTLGPGAWGAAAFFFTWFPDPKPTPPEPPGCPPAAGQRLMRSMSDALAKSKSFSFETREQLEVIAPSGEKKTVHFIRNVTVRRPNALYFQLNGQDENPIEIDAYYDGRTVTLNEK